jgi:uncharacterized protein YkwD
MLLVHLSCGAGGLESVDARTGAPSRGPHEEERRLCVEITNRYRASIGASPVEPSPVLERYAAEAASRDGRAHRAHAFFRRTNGGGVARAENLVPWWPLSHFETVAAVVERGLAMMWDEGPDGPHRRNIAGPYTEVGCGIFVNGDEVTVVQAFR